MDDFVEQVLENWNKAFLTNSSRFSSVNQRFLSKIVSSPMIKVQNSKEQNSLSSANGDGIRMYPHSNFVFLSFTGKFFKDNPYLFPEG